MTVSRNTASFDLDFCCWSEWPSGGTVVSISTRGIRLWAGRYRAHCWFCNNEPARRQERRVDRNINPLKSSDSSLKKFCESLFQPNSAVPNPLSIIVGTPLFKYSISLFAAIAKPRRLESGYPIQTKKMHIAGDSSNRGWSAVDLNRPR